MLTRHLLEKLQKKPNYKNEQSIENKQNELKREACRPSQLSQIRRFSSDILRASPRISLVSTSKLAGVPASSVFSPFTMLS